MKTRLTITLDKELIVKAKNYAKESSLSLSEIVENHLKTISEKDFEEIKITPFVRSMSSKLSLPTDLDYKKEYTDYLIEKYK